jgi:hypothetical protein
MQSIRILHNPVYTTNNNNSPKEMLRFQRNSKNTTKKKILIFKMGPGKRDWRSGSDCATEHQHLDTVENSS